jgi:hypothetical protein
MDKCAESLTKTIWKSYDLKKKRAAVQHIDAFFASGWSHRIACSFLGFHTFTTGAGRR